jgi:hypothetical protein
MRESWRHGQVATKREPRTAYAAARFVERMEREHGRLIYQWHHPENVAWARARDAARDGGQRGGRWPR